MASGAGCGSEILNDAKADLFITGEFSHEEIMHEIHRGVSLILTDHTNTERGYSQFFREKFIEMLKKTDHPHLEIVISEKDRDPLQYI